MFRLLILTFVLLASLLFAAQTQKDGAKSKGSEQQTNSGTGEEYTCTMHPEIRSKEKGKCPKCAMSLVSVLPAIMDNFQLKMDVEPSAPKPNEKVKLTFRIYNPRTGAQVTEFALLHEKMFHLFIISQDLSQFQHIHPVFFRDGSFSIETVLPQAGRYKIYCDFYPLEGSPQVLQHNLTTAGYKGDLFSATPNIHPEENLIKVCEGIKITKETAANAGVDLAILKPKQLNDLKVELKLEPAKIIAGKPTLLKYHLTDAKTGSVIKDL